VSIQGFAGLFPQGRPISARLDGYLPGLYPRFSNGTLFAMRNGLYSLQMHMLDGVKGRDSGVIILRDGKLIGGGPYFWSIGTYTVGDGTWKGFQGRLRMTGRRCSARPWWAQEAWAFALP
jgi:hypothetical protein